MYVHVAVVAGLSPSQLGQAKALGQFGSRRGNSEDAGRLVAGSGMDTGDRAYKVGRKVRGGSLLSEQVTRAHRRFWKELPFKSCPSWG